MSTDIAEERLARRIQELYASDPQFAAARFDEAVSAAIERPGLRLSQLVVSRSSRRLCAEWQRWPPAGSEPSEVFDAVTNEMCRCVPAEGAGLWRYETSGEITLVAEAYLSASAPAKWPVGTRTPIAGNTLASMVQRTGGPARMDSYENVAGDIAAHVRAVGIRAAVGVPVIVDGRVWGMAAHSLDDAAPSAAQVDRLPARPDP